MQNKTTMQYITSQIRYICARFKGRKAGSAAERGCQLHLKKELAKWADTVREEAFSLHPDAFYGWLTPFGACSIVSALCVCLRGITGWPGFAWLGALCMTAALLLFLFEFVFYHKIVDFAFPKAESLNIFAARKPRGEATQRIIFGGHADAAFEMRYIRGRKGAVYWVIGAGVLAFLYVLVISALSLASIFHPTILPVGGAAGYILAGIALLCIPLFILVMRLIDRSIIVDGANDNLSSCLAGVGILRDMKRKGIRLEHTEVCCLITGGEESGLRGAEAFARAHKQEFTDMDTIFIALETLREADQLMVYTRGINGTQKNSAYVAGMLRAAGADCGIPLPDAGLYPGATDAEAFSREGLLACALGGVNHQPQPYYHTREDTCENISEACIAAAMDICMRTALNFDAQACLQQELCRETKEARQPVARKQVSAAML